MLGGVAQLVRATACHAVGHRFESGRPRKIKNILFQKVFFKILKLIPGQFYGS